MCSAVCVSGFGAPEVFCYGSGVGRGCFSRDQGRSYQKEEGQGSVNEDKVIRPDQLDLIEAELSAQCVIVQALPKWRRCQEDYH